MRSFLRDRAFHEWKVKELAFRDHARLENVRRHNRQRGFIINPYGYAVSGPTDPYFASVVSLAHFDDTPGGFTGPWVDQIAARSPGWTRIAAGTISNTTTKQFGAASLECAGVGAYNADHADWNFGSGDFTVECWFQRNTGGISQTLFCQYSTSGGNKAPFWCALSNVNRISFGASTTNASWDWLVSDTTGTTISVWHHAAMNRTGSTVRGYLNGVEVVASGTLSGAVVNNTNDVTIGNTSDNPGNVYFLGFIDDFRATKGVGRYPSAFTPPAAAFPNS